MTGPAGAWTGTRPISSRPTSLVPPGNTRTGLAVATPGGHSRQADRPVAADDDGHGAVTDRDLKVNANRRSARPTEHNDVGSDGRRPG